MTITDRRGYEVGEAIPGTPGTPGSVAFAVNKGGSNQANIADSTFTIVEWSNELYDRDGRFDANAWTPPAGIVSMSSQCVVTGTWSAGAILALAIFKNGTVLIQGSFRAPSANVGTVFVSGSDLAGGSDVYDVRIFVDTSSGTSTISGNTATAYFCGFWLGP